MSSTERLKLLRFLAQNGIKANAFSDAELRQRAQKILSAEKLKVAGVIFGKGLGQSKKKQQFRENPLSTKKLPGK